MASTARHTVLGKTSDEMPAAELSPNSSSTSNARLTPDSDSEESDLEIGELGESFKLQPRRKDAEKRGELDEDDDEDDRDVGYRDSGRRRASVSTVQSYQLYTPDEERAVVRKFDRKLVLFVALLYMLSFLDRSSLFAAIAQGHC
jgi:hypothetical protein